MPIQPKNKSTELNNVNPSNNPLEILLTQQEEQRDQFVKTVAERFVDLRDRSLLVKDIRAEIERLEAQIEPCQDFEEFLYEIKSYSPLAVLCGDSASFLPPDPEMKTLPGFSD